LGPNGNDQRDFMGNGFQFFDIILFALIAVFLILRLRNTLGRRDGHEGGYDDPFGLNRDERERGEREAPQHDADTQAEEPDNVIQLPGARPQAPHDPWAPETAASVEPDTPLGRGLSQIGGADPNFTPESFIEGAQVAFEMILNAFTTGDVKALKSLLSDEVYENFASAVRAREDAGEVLEETLVGIKSAELVEAELDDRIASITVKFVTEQVSALRNASGDVIEGNPSEVITVTDYWTFARDSRSRDPNWTLVATRSPD
jgi:predicted lipid-binding transport protein (Tim44 family)